MQIDEILASLEIEVIGRHRHRGDMQTFARKTIASILRTHGEKHSDIMLAFPKWPAQGLVWIEAFDGIRLLGLMDLARKLRGKVKPRAAIAGMLAQALKDIFEPPPPPKPVVAMRPSGAMRAIAEGLILLEHKGPPQTARSVASPGKCSVTALRRPLNA